MAKNINDYLDYLDSQTTAPAAQAPTGWMRGIGDNAIALGTGAVGAFKSISDVAGPNNWASKSFGRSNELMQELYSPARAQEMQNRQGLIDAADKSNSTVDQITTRLGGIAEAPLQTMGNAFGSIAPNVIGGAVSGTLKVGTGLAALATRYGIPAMLGIGMGVGSIKGQNFDAVFKEAKQNGFSEDEAVNMAMKASEYSAKNAPQQALGGALGALDSMTGVNRLMTDMFKKEAKQVAAPVARSFVPRVLLAGGEEAIPEGLQGAQGQYAQNEAMNNAGFKTNPWAGVLGAGINDAAVGGMLGGAMGVKGHGPTVSGLPDANTAPALPGAAPLPPVAPAAPPAGPMERAARAAAPTQATIQQPGQLSDEQIEAEVTRLELEANQQAAAGGAPEAGAAVTAIEAPQRTQQEVPHQIDNATTSANIEEMADATIGQAPDNLPIAPQEPRIVASTPQMKPMDDLQASMAGGEVVSKALDFAEPHQSPIANPAPPESLKVQDEAPAPTPKKAKNAKTTIPLQAAAQPNPQAAAQADSLVQVTDLGGKTHHVKLAQLGGKAASIPTYTPTGEPAGRLVARKNIAPSGQSPSTQSTKQAMPPAPAIATRAIPAVQAKAQGQAAAKVAPTSAPAASTQSAPIGVTPALKAPAPPDPITTKSGGAFKEKAVAMRELKVRTLGDTHEVVPANTVKPGTAGFFVQKKAAPVAPTTVDPVKTDAAPAAQDGQANYTATDVVESPVSSLSLSGDVPQFKSNSDANGITQGAKLEGKYDRRMASPIQVWQRNDGRMEVISGRHRLDLAQRSGETTIPTQIYKEQDGFTADMARTLDIELNVKDGRGKVKDYVAYFKELNPTQEQARADGLLNTAVGRQAYTISDSGSETLIASHANNAITDDAAVSIAQNAPNNDALQNLGMQHVANGKTINFAVNVMRAAKAAGFNGDGTSSDLFGFDDSFAKEAESIAKEASRQQHSIRQQLSAIRGASKRPELAAQGGVDVKNSKVTQDKITKLEGQLSGLDGFSTNPDIYRQLRVDAGLAPNGEAAPDQSASTISQTESEKEVLTAPTRAEVLAQQDRTDNAQALDNRAQIDAEASRQTLTRQTAPEQRRDTSVDMFGEEKAVLESAKRETDAAAKNEAAKDPNQGSMFDGTAGATEASDGINDHIRALRAKAHKGQKRDTDVRLSTNPDLYVAFEDAVKEARKAVAKGTKAVPFQIHNALDIGIGETDRVIAEVIKPFDKVKAPEVAPVAPTQPATVARTPNPDELRAQADLQAALADLGDISDKNTRMDTMPEQEAKILPVMAIDAVDARNAAQSNSDTTSQASTETLTAPTREDVLATQARAEAAAKSAKTQKRATDELARRAQERKDIAHRSEGAADSFELGQDPIQSLSGQGGMFGRGGDTAFKRGHANNDQATQHVTAIVSAIQARWHNAPDIIVAASMSDEVVPQNVRDQDAQQKALGAVGEPEGFYYRGKVYLVAHQLPSDADVVRVIFHEVLGHVGLKGVFGDKLHGILDQIAALRRPLVAAKAEQYGLDMAVQAHRREAAEEVLAVMAEKHPELGYVKRAISLIRAWLRQHVPGFSKMQLTDSDIITQFILPARRYVERGRGAAPKAATPAMSRSQDKTDTAEFKEWFGESKVVDAKGVPLVVYHGSPDLRFINTDGTFKSQKERTGFGNEQQAHWFTPSQATANTYANPHRSFDYQNAQEGTIAAFIKLENPLVIDASGANWRDAQKHGKTSNVITEAHANGHDGVIIHNVKDDYNNDKKTKKTDTYVVFESNQIKSAIGNNGDFDGTNGDIRYSRATINTITKQVTDTLGENFSHPGKMSWWDKSVGSQYHLAERSAPFKRVFSAGQNFINDVSFYATEAADLAPKILPKLDTWGDLLKTPVTAQDNRAISAPILQGTLSWARDEAGKAFPLDDLALRYEALNSETKAQMLLKNGIVTADQLKRWKASPLDIYAGAVRNRFVSKYLKAGVVWSDKELVDLFKLTPAQIGLYREFRTTTDKSLDNLAKSDLLRFGGKDVADLREMVMSAPDANSAAVMLRDHLLELGGFDPERADVLRDTANGMMGRADKVAKLKAEGYAPLSRFGRYSVDVVVDDERQYFSLFESARAANQMALKLKGEYGAANVVQGTLSEREFEQFQGITPESLELFGNMLRLDSTGGDASDKAFQAYLKLTKSNRSAMKRMIHRKGTAGFSEDMGRVLAAFVYSNARQTGAALHMGELGDAVNAIPKGEGELKDHAIGLADYIKKPREEAQALRGMLFAQYLGGSVASALVNFTQPMTVSFPYLSQYGGAAKSASALVRAMADQRAGKVLEAGLAGALRIAEEQGVVSPQSVHQLMAQAQGTATLDVGDGTKAGDAKAAVGNYFTKLALGWGKLFGMAEQINRRSTFIAAYRMAVDQKIKNPAAFATKAVDETQFVNNKGNKARWARGPVGATLMTFKSYSLNYLELLHRMSTQNGPEGKKAAALMLGMLMLMSGAGGLPFVEDIDDLVDALAQRMGYNFSTKKAKQEFLHDTFGRAGGDFVDKGISGLPGAPIDVSMRMGMGNLIPGTGLLLKKADHTSDLTEFAGPAGDLIKRAFTAGGQALSGDLGKAALTLAPKAVGNLAKGMDMANTGTYRDTKGMKVMDTTPTEAAMKMIGFQPGSVADDQEANQLRQVAKNFYSLTAADIRARWASGLYNKDAEAVQAARQALRDWNEKNPDQRIDANLPAILRRVREMGKTKDQRVADSAPKNMRTAMRREIESERLNRGD